MFSSYLAAMSITDSMELFLLKELSPLGTGYQIRPVPYRDPDQLTMPLWLPKTSDAVSWLERYGQPEFNPYYGQKGSVIILGQNLGYWPPPYISDYVTFLKDFTFNDEINF